MKGIIYLDTSGLNFLSDFVKSYELFSEIKKSFNFDLYISSVTLWEVLLNSDSSKREKIIYWAQMNCSGKLLKSPSEIIFDFIKNDCPTKDRVEFFKSPFSSHDFAITWKNIHGKIDRTIPVDLGELKERAAPLRMLSKKFKSIIHGMVYGDHQDELFNEWMLELVKNLDGKISLSKDNETLIKTSLIICLFVVCIGIELQNNEVRKFWGDKKIDDPLERMDYLIKENPIALIRGPIVEMANMAVTQISMSNSKSRGLFHDCLHSIYCYYSHQLVTADEHFKALRDNHKHPAFDQVVMADECQRLWNILSKKANKKFQVTPTAHLN